LDRSPVKSIRYKGAIYKTMLWLFVLNFIMLGYLGVQPTTDLYKLMAQIGTIFYFAFFLLMPVYSKMDKTKPVPERVTK
ncbi:MAG: cytochrome b, partial [Candidatus Sedimenticola sp. 6PFRAG1]